MARPSCRSTTGLRLDLELALLAADVPRGDEHAFAKTAALDDAQVRGALCVFDVADG